MEQRIGRAEARHECNSSGASHIDHNTQMACSWLLHEDKVNKNVQCVVRSSSFYAHTFVQQ